MTHAQKVWKVADVSSTLDGITLKDIERLKEWTHRNPDRIPQNLTDEILLLFLHACRNNLENAKKCMTEHYRLRRKAKQILQERNIMSEDLQRGLEVLHYGIIRSKTSEGYRVVFHSLRDNDPSKYSFNVGFKLLSMAVETLYIKEGPSPGLVMLFDLTGVKIGHVARLPIINVKRALEYIQDAIPLRLQSIHVLNCHSIIDKIMFLIKPFLRKHLLSLLHFYQENDESVFEIIPRECVPEDFGGTYIPVKKMHEEFIEEIKELAPVFIQDDCLLENFFKTRKNGAKGDDEIDITKLEID